MTDPRIHQRRVEVARAAGRRRLKALVAGVVLALLTSSALVVLHSPLFAVRHVTVVGAPGIPRPAVLTAAGLAGHPPLVDVDTAAVARRVSALPEVASVAVHEEWPSGVEIVLTERHPMAVAAPPPAAAGGYAVLDSAGHVLETVATRPTLLPVVDLPQPAGAPGSLAGPAALPLLATAAAVPASLMPALASIGYDASGDIVLRLVSGVLVVMGGAAELGAKFAALETVLQAVGTAGTATIDVTVPNSPVVTPARRTVQGVGDG